MDRRTLLQAIAAWSAWRASGLDALAAPLPPDALERFMTLSSALTGVAVDDVIASAEVLDAFATPERRASVTALADLVAATPADALDAAIAAKKLDGVANEIVSIWYSGVAGSGDAQKVVLYLNALVWNAMTFAKPMGVCGGPTGYWALPPLQASVGRT